MSLLENLRDAGFEVILRTDGEPLVSPLKEMTTIQIYGCLGRDPESRGGCCRTMIALRQ
jgi:hypothetical protein